MNKNLNRDQIRGFRATKSIDLASRASLSTIAPPIPLN